MGEKRPEFICGPRARLPLSKFEPDRVTNRLVESVSLESELD